MKLQLEVESFTIGISHFKTGYLGIRSFQKIYVKNSQFLWLVKNWLNLIFYLTYTKPVFWTILTNIYFDPLKEVEVWLKMDHKRHFSNSSYLFSKVEVAMLTTLFGMPFNIFPPKSTLFIELWIGFDWRSLCL